MAIIFKISISKANRSIRLFLWVPILFFLTSTIAKQEERVTLQTAYSQYFSFELDSCSKSLQIISTSPSAFYLEILLESTRIFIEDDLEAYKNKKYLENELLEKLDTLNFTEVQEEFLRSEIKLQWAVLKLKNGEEFSSFWSFRQAYNIAKNNVGKNPQFLPSYKTLGLLHVLYGIFPDKYNWILSIFGIEGDVKRGLTELKKVHRSDVILSIECGMTIALLDAYLLDSSSEAVEIMGQIHEKRNHLLIDYSYLLILIKNSESERAFDIILNAEQVYPQPFMLAQLYYVKGEVLLQKGRVNEAIENYQVFLKRHPGTNLVKDAYYKMGICNLILGMPNQAENNFEKAKQNGWAKNEADKHAAKVLESDHFSNEGLYRLRYATDGGFYEKAMNIRNELETVNLNAQDECEYYYRSARLFHKTASMESAVENYIKTINSQGENNWYFAPNSALHLAQIYMERNDTDIAKKYLSTINEYSGYPYQTSIRQKAKMTLKEID